MNNLAGAYLYEIFTRRSIKSGESPKKEGTYKTFAKLVKLEESDEKSTEFTELFLTVKGQINSALKLICEQDVSEGEKAELQNLISETTAATAVSDLVKILDNCLAATNRLSRKRRREKSLLTK